jgi:glycosyltransferase involved in cell wall biosynthesis
MSRRRPDIAIFLLWVGPGGKETVVWNLARDFVERGFRVDVVLGLASSGHEHRIPAGPRVVDLRAGGYRRATIQLAHYLVRCRPRVLFSTLPFSAIPAILAALLVPVRTRVVLRVSNNLPMRIKHESVSFPRTVTLLLRHLPRLASAVVSCSRGVAATAASALGLAEEDFTVIGNPGNVQEMSRAGTAPVEPWIDRPDANVILGAGRLAVQKNFPMLIRALGVVRKSADASLVILGEGPERKSLERLIRDEGLERHVLLPGRVENPYAYMARCRVFALSSSWEGLPNVVIEALAMGAPVVATDCPSGPAEILDGGRFGFLVPVDDHRAMARAILAVLGGERREAPDEWLRRFSVAEVVPQYLKIFRLPETPAARRS